MLLNDHHHLPSGAHVRLRLPMRADTPRLRALVGAEEADRLLRFDPRRRAVICALEFEEVVGVGAIELRHDARPELIVAADAEVGALLERALTARARTARRAPERRGSRLRLPRRR